MSQGELMTQLGYLLKILVAMVLGGIIGIDREIAQKPAGIRTHMMVSTVSALLVILGILTIESYRGVFGDSIVTANPIRIIAAVVTGISFLGAGTIIRLRADAEIEGLTTAASILFASAIGMSVALSYWVLAVGASIIALVILWFVQIIWLRYIKRIDN